MFKIKISATAELLAPDAQRELVARRVAAVCWVVFGRNNPQMEARVVVEYKTLAAETARFDVGGRVGVAHQATSNVSISVRHNQHSIDNGGRSIQDDQLTALLQCIIWGSFPTDVLEAPTAFAKAEGKPFASFRIEPTTVDMAKVVCRLIDEHLLGEDPSPVVFWEEYKQVASEAFLK